MKKSNFKIYVTAFSLISLVGCIDLGDVKDYGSYSPDNVWNDEKLSSAYLSNLYAMYLEAGRLIAETMPTNRAEY